MIFSWRLPLPGRDPFADEQTSARAMRFGLLLFLAALAMLFAATLIGFAMIRVQLALEWPRDLPALPLVLWLSTVVLLASSGTVQWAMHTMRRGDRRACNTAMMLTTLLGFVFLLMQAAAWFSWLAAITDFWAGSDAYRFALTCFYVLTGLHAAHVLGGLLPMFVITRRAFRGTYTAERHRGVELIAVYWHFLDVVWLILFASLLIGV